MISEFYTLFTKDAVHRLALVTNVAAQCVATFEQQFREDKTCQKECLDSVIDLLQKHQNAVNQAMIAEKAATPA